MASNLSSNVSQAVDASLQHLLEGPAPPTCTSKPIDFVKAGLPGYSSLFALTIHDLLTPEECASFLTAASATTDNKFEQAMINIGGGRQMLVVEARNCGRIIWDTHVMAKRLLDRIMPHLPKEMVTLDQNARVTGNGPTMRKEVWRISRLNERLRFLKYTSGMYFREHCDGSYVTPDGKEISFLTVHLYLNGDPATPAQATAPGLGENVTGRPKDDRPLVGGATRFLSMSMGNYMDVLPETGSCVVFQHRGLLHSGEDVMQGTKYTMRTDVMYEKVETCK